jgi:hypothetical protein
VYCCCCAQMSLCCRLETRTFFPNGGGRSTLLLRRRVDSKRVCDLMAKRACVCGMWGLVGHTKILAPTRDCREQCFSCAQQACGTFQSYLCACAKHAARHHWRQIENERSKSVSMTSYVPFKQGQGEQQKQLHSHFYSAKSILSQTRV